MSAENSFYKLLTKEMTEQIDYFMGAPSIERYEAEVLPLITNQLLTLVSKAWLTRRAVCWNVDSFSILEKLPHRYRARNVSPVRVSFDESIRFVEKECRKDLEILEEPFYELTRYYCEPVNFLAHLLALRYILIHFGSFKGVSRRIAEDLKTLEARAFPIETFKRNTVEEEVSVFERRDRKEDSDFTDFYIKSKLPTGEEGHVVMYLYTGK